MTAVRNRSWRSLAFVTALATVFALALPFMPKAEAQPAPGASLEVTLETDSNPTGNTHTLTAYVYDPGAVATDAGADAGPLGTEIDFEIESGPATRVNCTLQPNDSCSGGTASDDGNTPTTPDMTCTVADAGGATCSVTFTSDAAGTNIIRAWIDADRSNGTTEADASEGRYAGGPDVAGAGTPTDCRNGYAAGPEAGCVSGTAQPGATTEPDVTDVVQKSWFGAVPANASLDCTPETATNPSTGDGSSETYTCTLFNDNGAGGGTANDDVKQAGETGISGVAIDGENQAGDNDPDDADPGTSADYNDACTTGADGSCQITIPASEQQGSGVATEICFWGDFDADTQAGGQNGQIDGGGCNEANNESGTASDIIDVVQKTWRARGVPATVELSPSNDQNVIGTSHTVTATVTDFFGTPVQGAAVDFDVTGKNTASALPANNVITNAQGQATYTYTDDNTAPTPEGEQDTIEGCVDNDGLAGCTGAEPVKDTANKFWFTAVPVAGDVVLDATNNGGLDDCEDTDAAAENSDSNPVATTHDVCASVFRSGGQALAGAEVTFTIEGPGVFYNDANNNETFDTGETELGKTTTGFSDSTGNVSADIYSEESGVTTVTATSGGQSDSVTKTWTPLTGRNINCDPDTATNVSGTEHIIECEVTDRYGNPTGGNNTGGVGADDEVNFTETGPGRITSDSSPQIGTDGLVEVVVETIPGETGTQSITGELEPDVGQADSAADTDDACDQPANDGDTGGAGPSDPGAPAGNCEETVEKIWTEEPEPAQCSDDVDNDGDGLVDDQDGGCYDEDGNYDADDDDETNVTERTLHSRSVEITKFKHIDLPGKKKPALMVKGRVTVDDGFAECNNVAPVKVQIRASGEWITRKTDFTNDNGVFKVLVRHVHAKYRVIAARFELFDQFGNVDVCQRAEDTRRYRH